MKGRGAKRARETAEEAQKALIEISQDGVLVGQADEDLFQLDVAGSQRLKKKMKKVSPQQDSENSSSKQLKLSESVVAKIVSKNQKERNKLQELMQSKEIYDIWGSDVKEAKKKTKIPDVAERRTKSELKETVKVKVASAGFSYNPSERDHLDVIAEATALEIQQRQYAKKEREIEVPNIPDRRTIELLQFAQISGSSSARGVEAGEKAQKAEQEQGDEEEEQQAAPARPKLKARKTRRKTRLERNIERRAKLKRVEKAKKLYQQRFMASISNAEKILKSIERKEERKRQEKEIKEVLKNTPEDPTALNFEEAALVPLSDELGGSLRLLRPKGSRIKEQFSVIRKTSDLHLSNNQANKIKRKRDRAKVKWIPKYKLGV